MRTVTETNLDLIKSLLESFATRNLAAVRGMLTYDVCFHFPGNNSLSGEYRGRECALDLLERVNQWTQGTTRIRLHDMLANDQHGVLLYTVSAKHGNREVKCQYLDVYHFRDGQISEVRGYVTGDHSLFDSFYSE